ncbi:MAG: hypothetical protein GX539_05380, partial [Candidatus Cloacimonetes bacterium]|nr:hypothetical protein [Candidatus Cloacimonadota bacterium]
MAASASLLLVACAAAPSAAPRQAGGPSGDAAPSGATGADAGSEWIRVISPFEVRDEQGTPYRHPFLGGFDVPRPQLVDIDGDGDLDLFVQERSGEVMFLENTGTPAQPRFTWRTDRFHDLDVGE